MIAVVLFSTALPTVSWGVEYKGLTFEAVYTLDYFVNTSGGLKRDDTYLTNLDLTLNVDTQEAGLWENGQLFMSWKISEEKS